MTTMTNQTLAQFIREVMQPNPEPLDEDGPRHHGLVPIPESAGRVVEIDEETYWWFLEVLPPYYMEGNRFCFAEGFVPFHFFFMRGERYFVRLLTWDETRTFCRLADVPLPGR